MIDSFTKIETQNGNKESSQESLGLPRNYSRINFDPERLQNTFQESLLVCKTFRN